MSLIDSLQERAAALKGHVVLAEGEDRRTVEAAAELKRRGICRITLTGSRTRITELAEQSGLSLSARELADPADSEWTDGYARELFRLRKHKGMALEEAGLDMGFTHVASGPMVRSSYHADRMAAEAGFVADAP